LVAGRKDFTDEQLAVQERMNAQPGDMLLFVADTWAVSCKALHNLRKRVGVDLKLYDPKAMNFSWIVEFPMFEFDKEENRWNSMHHPFTAPRPQDVPLLDSDPGKARAVLRSRHQRQQAGGGDRRITMGRRSQVFRLLGIDAERENRFSSPRRPADGRSASQRHRARNRPHRDALQHPRQHPRSHRLPKTQRPLTSDRRARALSGEAAQGIGDQSGRA
jgi:hypothetical protein